MHFPGRFLVHSLSVGFFAVAVSLALAGCSFGPSLHPVEGKVTVDEKPLPKGTVTLWPMKEKGNPFAGQPSGDVDNGNFKMMTKGSAGVPAGWYKATISDNAIPDSTKPDAIKNSIGEVFRDPARSTLLIEVTANPTAGAYDLKASAK